MKATSTKKKKKKIAKALKQLVKQIYIQEHWQILNII